MYELIIGLKDAGKYLTFPEAFGALHKKLIGMGEAGIPLRPETVFIGGEIEGMECPLGFCDILDLACDIGLLSDKGLQETTLGPEQEEAIKVKFLFAGRRFARAIKRLGEDRRKVSEEFTLFQ